MDADGRHVQQVTRPPERSDDDNPDWSPDGTKIAFDRAIDERGDESSEVIGRRVFVAGSDGRGLRRLTPLGGDSYGPVWSPDGAQVAYGTQVAYDKNGINVVNSDGTKPRRLTNAGGLPAWSPDGTKIAFFSTRDDPPDFTFDQVYVMNADGSNQRRLSHTGTADTELVWLE
jgi:TolB protein